MNKLPECERPSVSLLACRRAQHATPQPKRSADCPRSRGVYAATILGMRLDAGSSPLARGLRSHDPGDAPGRRIIPARAGFTPPTTMTLPRRPDHPRSRGVYETRRSSVAATKGSSPLARGLPPVPGHAGERQGIIPRSRGVYGARSPPVGTSLGSSPLARGLLFLLVMSVPFGGIIPARAGFTHLLR